MLSVHCSMYESAVALPPALIGLPPVPIELEANNFFDKDGNCKKGKYFEDGYVAEEGESGPGALPCTQWGWWVQHWCRCLPPVPSSFKGCPPLVCRIL